MSCKGKGDCPHSPCQYEEILHEGELIEKQGWNDESLLLFHDQFLTQKGLHDEFLDFLRKKAREENEEET